MSALTLVVVMLISICAAIAAVLITVAVSSFLQAHRDRLEPSLGDGRQAVVNALSGDGSKVEEALQCLRQFPERYITGVMLDLAPSVTGTSRTVMISLAEKIGLLRRARSGVRSRRWSRRLYAARVFTAFGIESDDLDTLVTDRSPEVRAQAARWCVATPTPSAIAHLIGLLNDVDGRCRFAAQDALIRVGLPGSASLLSALSASTGEASIRILRVAAAMGDDRFYEQAHALTTDPSSGIRSMAVAVLARTGNPHAGPTLVGMLNDESSDVALAAAEGLAKLGYWRGAPQVEKLLGHESWDVRKQAGLTLLALGAPGAVLLRATAPGDGPAAEMAVRALQVQSLSIEAEAA
jgi:HEAT repeat protein